ncbi:alpha/beta hydrolase [Actinoplanes sp. HUAS TT8]|uniref:alpha/beta hydrolase n=1 Tax=Actinoplanes sp. HUAS TT8 TaxID=3447453 RepID=UPI003F5239C4
MELNETQPSRLLSHGGQTERAVLLLHGYTHDPSQMAGLGAELFARGHNVWIPRAPGHGLSDPQGHRSITKGQLIAYANKGLEFTKELGVEVGVVGISGGAVLAARLAADAGNDVRRMLLLAPFFRPDPAQAPSALVAAMTLLYGRRLIPDRITSRGYSLRAVAQYLAVARTLRPACTGLRSLALVLGSDDTVVDAGAAIAVAGDLARSNGIPLALHTVTAGHDVLKAPGVEGLYADLYEGGPGGSPVPLTGATGPTTTGE